MVEPRDDFPRLHAGALGHVQLRDARGDLRREIRLALRLDVAGRGEERRGLPLRDDGRRHGLHRLAAQRPSRREEGGDPRRDDEDRGEEQPPAQAAGLLGLSPDAERREVGRSSFPFLAHGSTSLPFYFVSPERPAAPERAGVIINSMLWNSALLAAVISIQAATPASQRPRSTGSSLPETRPSWSEDLPRDSGALLLFHRYPGGMLVSVKKADVRARRGRPADLRGPQEAADGRRNHDRDARRPVVIGIRRGGEGLPRGTPELAPGERKDGTALLNPDRPYRPEWDSKQVPGQESPVPEFPQRLPRGQDVRLSARHRHPGGPGRTPQDAAGSGEPPKGPQ